MPAQTRGFLFSDLRGYSAFVERHGDRAARELLTRYRRIVRGVIARFGGAEIRTEGDSFYVVFVSVSQAVEAGLAIQAALAQDTEGEAIRAGIGIHAGEVEDDAEQGIVSGAVNIAARICGVAEPREVLVSETVRGLTRGYLDVSFVPRGRRRLKGIRDPLLVYGVTAGQSQRPERGPSRWKQVGLAAAVVLLGIGVAASALQPVGGGVADVRQSDTPMPSALASSVAHSSAEAGMADGLTEEQEANLAYIAPSRHDSCAGAAAEHAPRFRDARGLDHDDPVPLVMLPTVGGIECRLGGFSAPDSVWIWRVASSGTENQGVAPNTAEEWMLSHAAQLSANAGTCTPGAGPMLEDWSFSGRSGMLLCYETATGDAIVYWTYDHHDDVLGKALRDDRDMSALLGWWRIEARAPD